MLQLIAGWLLLLALIVFGARWQWGEKTQEGRPPAVAAEAVSALAEKDAALLQTAIPECFATLSRFLVADTPEARNQFVFSPISTAYRIARFYSLNPSTQIDPQSIELVMKSVLRLPGGPAIETRWKYGDGQQLDAVFRKQNGEWRLDWDQFTRYGDYPWSLFLSGTGPSEGEFRVLVRERLAEERKDAETISLKLYAPRFGHPEETGFQSSEFLVSRKTRDGQLLDAAFKLARSGGRVFDSRLPELDPDGMIRARVKVRRIDKELDRSFEITRVIACHWCSVDDPGVEPLEWMPAKENPVQD